MAGYEPMPVWDRIKGAFGAGADVAGDAASSFGTLSNNVMKDNISGTGMSDAEKVAAEIRKKVTLAQAQKILAEQRAPEGTPEAKVQAVTAEAFPEVAAASESLSQEQMLADQIEGIDVSGVEPAPAGDTSVGTNYADYSDREKAFVDGNPVQEPSIHPVAKLATAKAALAAPAAPQQAPMPYPQPMPAPAPQAPQAPAQARSQGGPLWDSNDPWSMGTINQREAAAKKPAPQLAMQPAMRLHQAQAAPADPMTAAVAAQPAQSSFQPTSEYGRQINAGIDQAVAKYNLPPEAGAYLRAITDIESGWGANTKGQAIGSEVSGDMTHAGDRAMGPFQFMSKTAQAYGLKDRMDPVASADAAARHLMDSYKKQGSWHKAAIGHHSGGSWKSLGKHGRDYDQKLQARVGKYRDGGGPPTGPTPVQAQAQGGGMTTYPGSAPAAAAGGNQMQLTHLLEALGITQNGEPMERGFWDRFGQTGGLLSAAMGGGDYTPMERMQLANQAQQLMANMNKQGGTGEWRRLQDGTLFNNKTGAVRKLDGSGQIDPYKQAQIRKMDAETAQLTGAGGMGGKQSAGDRKRIAESREQGAKYVSGMAKIDKLEDRWFELWKGNNDLGPGITDRVSRVGGWAAGTESFQKRRAYFNDIKADVYKMLKETFGGQLTEGERAALESVALTEDMGPIEAEAYFDRAKQIIEARRSASGAAAGMGQSAPYQAPTAAPASRADSYY